MNAHTVKLLPAQVTIEVPTGALVAEAIQLAGLQIAQPCGGQGRCGRCAVIVEQGAVRLRSTIRLSAADLDAGYALACQAVIAGDEDLTPKLLEEGLAAQVPAQRLLEEGLQLGDAGHVGGYARDAINSARRG